MTRTLGQASQSEISVLSSITITTTITSVHGVITRFMTLGILTGITPATTIHGIEEGTTVDITTLGTTTLGIMTLGTSAIRDSTVTTLDITGITDIQDFMIRSMAICTLTIADGTAVGGHITTGDITEEATSHLMAEVTPHQVNIKASTEALEQRRRPKTGSWQEAAVLLQAI